MIRSEESYQAAVSEIQEIVERNDRYRPVSRLPAEDADRLRALAHEVGEYEDEPHVFDRVVGVR